MRTRILALLLGPLVVLAACVDHQSPLAPEEGAPTSSQARGPNIIPGRFIVTLKPGANPAAAAATYGVEPDHIYTHALNGFAGSISEAARSGLLRDARVAAVEPDSWVYPMQGVQGNPTWGLDRIDQRALPLDDEYRYTRAGSGVTVYVIDSGIRFSHVEFGGRASNGYDFVWNDPEVPAENKGSVEGEDCSGHGTHVAGTVGGATYGVAKEVNLVSVRVFGCTGPSTWSRVIAAVDWVTANAAGPSVANLSLGGGTVQAADDAVRSMIAAGVATAVAAGNSNRENGACSLSPAGVSEAMTIGATNPDDWRSPFSNYGRCTDWYAPGWGILSAGHTGDSDTRSMSGTSMAAPHTAGVAALYLQAHPQALPAEVFDALRRATTKKAVWDWEYQYHHRNGKIIGQTEVQTGDLLYSLIDEPGVKPEITDLAAEAVSSSEIQLTWSYSASEPGEIEIQRRNPGEAQFVTVAIRPAGDESFTDTGLEPFRFYYYRVRAHPSDDSDGWSVVVDARTEPGDEAGPTVSIFEYECHPSQDGRCQFKSASEGSVISLLWRVEGEGSYTTNFYTYPFFTVVFGEPGSYTAIVTVTDAFGNTAEDSQSVTCRVQGNKLRCS